MMRIINDCFGGIDVLFLFFTSVGRVFTPLM